MHKNHFKNLLIASLMTASVVEANQEIPPLPPLPSVQDEAFNGFVQDTMPLTPDQIRRFRKQLDETERAAAELPNFIPTQVTTSGVVDLRPGQTSPLVRVFPGYISNVVFLDEAGSPVLIKDVVEPMQGGQPVFNLAWKEDGTNHSFRISPNSTYARGNISIMLDGVDIPVSITVISGQRQVDDRVDLRVRGLNLVSSSTPLPESADSELMPLLSGVAPGGAVPLKASAPEVQAWKWQGHVLVRTTGNLYSPSPLSMRSSSDGTFAAKLPLTSSAILSISGVRTMVKFEGL